MVLEQKEKNKNYILNNLDKFTIDGRGDFINLEKVFSMTAVMLFEKVTQKVMKKLEKCLFEKILKTKKG